MIASYLLIVKLIITIYMGTFLAAPKLLSLLYSTA